jgi:GSH-dependent disulfide-bond oxidoreductase
MSVPLELHGAKTGNCIRVAIALEETSVPYDVHPVDLATGGQRSPRHLTLNPLGKVPTLVDRSVPNQTLVLSQSNAILLYLAERSPGRLLPSGVDGTRELALERFFYFVVDVIAPSHAAFFLRQSGSEDCHVALSQQVLERLGVAETFLTQMPFMAGAEFSLADIAALTITVSLQDKLDWDSYPRLRRWFEAVTDRPSVRRGFRAFGV